jgi:phosphoglycolate phosphatase
MSRTVFFDLDGTLVDSLPGISESLLHATSVNGLSLSLERLRSAIGPPISSIITAAFPDIPEDRLARCLLNFRRHYDTIGYKNTMLFPGAARTLSTLRHLGYRLFIATNKPHEATVNILSHLNLSHFFDGLTCGDSPWTNRLATAPGKAARLLDFVAAQPIEVASVVGDSRDDYEAARAINANFFLATWGYGVSSVSPDVDRTWHLDNLNDLPRALCNLQQSGFC